MPEDAEELAKRNERVLSQAVAASLLNNGKWIVLVIEKADGTTKRIRVRSKSADSIEVR
jgi:hypothetical protein